MRKNLFLILILLGFLSLTFVSANLFSDLFGRSTGKVTSGVCGNGIIEPGEQCDGDWGSIDSCNDFGFSGGTLVCSSSCTFDTSKCVAYPQKSICGNGILESGEQCDDGNYYANDGCFNCQIEKTPITCTDSDDGDSPYVFGVVSSSAGDFKDACVSAEGVTSKTSLREFFCWYNAVNVTPYDCPTGCSDGACVSNKTNTTSCTDSDGGYVPNVKGTVTDKNGVQWGPETCFNDKAVNEFFCKQDGYVQIDVVSCLNGCVDGACVSNKTNTTKISCVEGASFEFYLTEGATWTITESLLALQGLKVTLISAKETNLKLSAQIKVENTIIDLTSDNPNYLYVKDGNTYTIYLVSASGATPTLGVPSATIGITCGIKTPKTPTCTEGESNSKEIQELESVKFYGNFYVTVMSAEETNLLLSATIRVDDGVNLTFINLTNNNPSTTVTVNGQVYTIELVSTTDSSATIQVTCGIKTPKTPTCTDSDDGDSPYVFGVVSSSAGDFKDACVSAEGAASKTSLREFFCWYNAVNVTPYDCPNGCSDGACTKKAKDASIFCKLFKFLPFCPL